MLCDREIVDATCELLNQKRTLPFVLDVVFGTFMRNVADMFIACHYMHVTTMP